MLQLDRRTISPFSKWQRFIFWRVPFKNKINIQREVNNKSRVVLLLFKISAQHLGACWSSTTVHWHGTYVRVPKQVVFVQEHGEQIVSMDWVNGCSFMLSGMHPLWIITKGRDDGPVVVRLLYATDLGIGSSVNCQLFSLVLCFYHYYFFTITS